MFSAAEKFWEQLPDKSKEALINAGQFGQLLKMGYAKGYDAFILKASNELGLSTDQVNEMLLALAKKLNIDINAPNQLFDKLQGIVDKGLEDSAWDNLWHSVSSQLAILFSGGRFNWSDLAMGLIEFVYKKFIAKA